MIIRLICALFICLIVVYVCEKVIKEVTNDKKQKVVYKKLK
jgi:hypothetical protein